MAINFPTSLDDSTSLPTRSSGNTIVTADTNDPKSAIIQLETKVGIGASPAADATDGQVLTKQADGSTAWETPTAGGGTVDVVSNVATNTLLGRVTAGSGDSEELTATQARTLLNVEDGADVTDATNVDAAGAVMNSDTSTASMSFVVDEDDMVSNSNTKVPTQQSVKAYVDAASLGGGGGATTLDQLTDVTIATSADNDVLAYDSTAGEYINQSASEAGLAAATHAHAPGDITGLTASATELNILDGATLSTTELNYVDGVTSAIQTQLDAKLDATDIASGTITPRADDVNLSGGSDGDVLTVQADGSLALETPAAGGASSIDDLSDVTISTPSDGQVLTYDSGTSQWVNENSASGFSNPMTTEGDVIIGGASGAAGRLGIGTAGQVLTVNAGATAPEWADAAAGGGGSSFPLTNVSIAYTSLDYLRTSLVGTGAVTASGSGGYARISAGATSGSLACLGKETSLRPSTLPRPWYGSVLGSMSNGTAGDGKALFGFHGRIVNTVSNMNTDHSGIYFEKISGTTTTYSSTADNTTQEKTAISGVSPTFGTRYSFVYNTDDTCDFYVDGILKNTHATNLFRTSLTSGLFLCQHSVSNSSANDFMLDVNVSTFSWEDYS